MIVWLNDLWTTHWWNQEKITAREGDLNIDARKKSKEKLNFFPDPVIIKTNLLNPAFLITRFFDIIFIAWKQNKLIIFQLIYDDKL